MHKTELPPEWRAAVRRFERKRNLKALAWACFFGALLAVLAAYLMVHYLTMGSNFPVMG